MNHTEIRKFIVEIYGLVDEWEVSSLNNGTAYYFKFKVGGKLYVASVHEEKNRAIYYRIEDETKYISATTKSKTFERDLRELVKWSFTQTKYILHPSN